MYRFRNSSVDRTEPIEYCMEEEYRPYDPDVPYYISINLVSYIVESLYDTPRSRMYDISLLSSIPKISDMYSTMDPETNLTCFTMCHDLWESEKYWLMILLASDKNMGKPSSQRLNITKVCARSLYHMYGAGGAPSYDNLRNDGTMASKTILFTVAAHTIRMASKVMPVSPRKKYSDLENSFSLLSDSPQKMGWRRRIKLASIGHIVMGWAAKMIRISGNTQTNLDNINWSCDSI